MTKNGYLLFSWRSSFLWAQPTKLVLHDCCGEVLYGAGMCGWLVQLVQDMGRDVVADRVCMGCS